MRLGTTKDGTLCVMDAKGRAAAVPDMDMTGLIAGDGTAKEAASKLALSENADRPAWDDVDWAAPLPRPARNIFCVGKNYVAHAEEFQKSGYDAADKSAQPDVPIMFSKAPEAVIGTGEDIIVPTSLTQEVDYEAEIAVVIGQGGRFISTNDAMDHVFGYTLINDVTARDLQKAHKQWFLGKSIDTFCPMGPWIVTRDAVKLEEVELRCEVNGALRQRAAASDMIFNVTQIISVLSRSLTLFPGDVIATGTPVGVGIGMEPPVFLNHGDVVSITATGMGTLENSVRFV